MFSVFPFFRSVSSVGLWGGEGDRDWGAMGLFDRLRKERDDGGAAVWELNGRREQLSLFERDEGRDGALSKKKRGWAATFGWLGEGEGRRCPAALWLLAKREGIGWRLGKKKYIEREGAPDCWLVFGQGRGSHCSLFLIKRIGLGFLFALYSYL